MIEPQGAYQGQGRHDRPQPPPAPTDHYGNTYYAPQPWQPSQPGGAMPWPHPTERQSQDAARDAQVAMVLGIVGLFFLSIVLGPLAVHFATRARRKGDRALPGLVLGWIALAVGILTLLPMLAAVIVVVSGAF